MSYKYDYSKYTTEELINIWLYNSGEISDKVEEELTKRNVELRADKPNYLEY